MATTVTQSELDTLNEENKVSTQAADVEQTYTGKFIGTLIGNATTAKELEAPYNFTLTGDATGTTKVNAKDTNLKVTVNHATEADTADFAGKTNLAARATLADMANTAEFAYRAGRLSNLIITLAGAITGTGQLTNSDQMKLTVSKLDASYLFVFSAKPDNPDQGKIYFDIDGRHLWIFDTATSKWKDGYSQLNYYINRSESRLGVLEPKMTTAQTDINNLKTLTNSHTSKLENHENRITVNENELSKHNERINTNLETINELKEKVATCETTNASQTQSLIDHEKRLGSIETTSDIGAFSQRMTAVEDKNEAQDLAISKETKARESAVQNVDAKFANYVTLNTAQSITKEKTLTTNLNFQDPSFDVLTADIGTKSVRRIVAKDKNNLDTTFLNFWLGNQSGDTTNQRMSSISLGVALNKDAATVVSNNIHLDGKLKKDGTTEFIAYCPTPPSDKTGTEITTAEWVNNKISATKQTIDTSINKNTTSITGLNSQVVTVKSDLSNVKSDLSNVKSNYVGISNAQQINGKKTFANNININYPTYDSITGDATLDIVRRIVAKDKNNLENSYINFWINNPTSASDIKRLSTLTLGVNLYKSSSEIKNSTIHLDGKLKKDGTTEFIAYCPTSPQKLYGDNIATAKWIYNEGGVVQTDNGTYIRFSNGMQLVWRGGKLENGTHITFGAPFKDTNYAIIGAGFLIDGITQTIIEEKTTTYFQITYSTRISNPYGYLCIGHWK